MVMAGRQAKPVFPNGAFYVKGLSLFGFVMFAMTPDEQRRCAEEMNRWMAEGKLKALIGRVFPFSDAASAHKLQEENTLGKQGTLSGKIILQRPIETEQMQKLLTTGKTDLLHRFISKKGRPFSAFLARGEEGKVTFEFAPREPKAAKPKAPAKAKKAAVT